MKKNVSPPPAFTLIELLAALAIVATLAALVLGTVETIRERASKVQCMANMRALYSGFSLYAADNKQAVARQSLPSSARHWHRNIWPYLDPSGTWENWGDAYAAASQGKPGWAYSCPSMTSTISSPCALRWRERAACRNKKGKSPGRGTSFSTAGANGLPMK